MSRYSVLINILEGIIQVILITLQDDHAIRMIIKIDLFHMIILSGTCF